MPDADRQVEDAERWKSEGGSFASEWLRRFLLPPRGDDAMQDNAAQFHWRLVGDGGKLSVSTTRFGSVRDAHLAAADVRLHVGSAEGTAGR